MELMRRRRGIMGLNGGAGIPIITATATGNPMTFETDLARPLKSLVIPFTPIQAAGTPSPDNPLPISGWTSATIYHTGKNVWGGRHAADQIKSVAGTKAQFSSDADGNYISLGGVAGGAKQLSLGVKFKPNTAYTLILKARCSANTNFTIRIYYTDGTQLALSPSSTYSETQIYRIVTVANKTVRGIYTLNRSQTLYIYYDYFGLFEGSISADNYESYQGLTLPINWQSEAGTVYGGTVTLNEDGSVDLVGRVGAYVITGNETWTKRSDTVYRLQNRNTGVGIYKVGNSKCNYFKTTTGYDPTDGSFSISTGDDMTYVSFCAPSFLGTSTTACQAKAKELYDNGTPIIFCSNLRTPITYHFANVGQLNSFLGTNNIWTDTNGTNTATYLKHQS